MKTRFWLTGCLLGMTLTAFADSHPAMRPLPTASTRPLPVGPLKFVDATKGDDQNAGSEAKPWRTLGFAVTKLAPGDTLVLRGGVYREHVTATCAGTFEKPIAIRSHPNELVILDGGIADFFDAPEKAWEPFAEGAPGEFRSTKTYENAGSASTDDQMETTLLGSFADSMVPLQGCHAMGDLRSTNPFWTLGGDHGSPAWEPLFFYHNTVLAGDEPFRGAYLDGLGRGIAPGSPRRLLNNIVVQAKGVPGTVMQEGRPDFVGDGNLHWSTDASAGISADEFLRKLRGARTAQELKAAQHDLFADPLLDGELRPQPKSPAIGAAVAIPQEWPAPLSTKDLGAVPAGAATWHAGVKKDDHASLPLPRVDLKPADGKPAAIVEGYPAFDAPLARYALRKQGLKVEVIERAWLDTARLPEFSLVVYAGGLARAKSPVSKFSADDLPRVRVFLEQGGTLVLLRATHEMFASDHGQAFLRELCGETPKLAVVPAQVLLPKHPWVKHLDPSQPHPWLAAKNAAPLRAVKGERILGTPEGLTTLCRIPVGNGALVYVGWEIAESIPHGRLKATVEMERIYEEQYRVLEKVLSAEP